MTAASATKKITKLTAAQEALLVEHREKWLQIGLCCEPADFATGDEVIRGFYKRLNKPEPLILHFSSPAMCELAVNVVFGMLGEKSQLYSQLCSQLRSQLDSQLRSQLRSQLDSQLYSQLDSQLGSQLYSQLGSQLRSQLRSHKAYFTTNRWGSQHWCAWEAFYLFGHEIGVKYDAGDIALLTEWGRLSQSVGWWAPWDGICFVSDRPRRVRFDGERRLHSEDGKAVEYSDGWGVSAWHGQRVPDEWLSDRKSLTPQAALTWQNVEQRRAACEILGWEVILSALDAKTIDTDGDPEIGSLVEVTIPEIGRERFLRVQCGTGRKFALPVPPNMKTALQANAWTFGFDDVSTFIKPEVRT